MGAAGLLFAGDRGKKLLEEIAPPRVVGKEAEQGAEAAKVGPTPEVIERIKKAIAEAETIEEVTRLEKALKSGVLPEDLLKPESEPVKAAEPQAKAKPAEAAPESKAKAAAPPPEAKAESKAKAAPPEAKSPEKTEAKAKAASPEKAKADAAAEPAAKKAKTDDYYIVVDGEKLDRKLWNLCEEYAKDGSVSKGEASLLWQNAMDGDKVTDTEKKTLEHSMKKHKYTVWAKKFLEKAIATGVAETSKAYYVEINGVKYDKELMEMAIKLAGDGQISEADAKKLWEAACDGKGVTPTEKKTLEYSMSHHKYTEPAKKFMQEKLGAKDEEEME